MHCHLDFETRSTVDLKRGGSYRYAEDPTTDVLCAAYAFSDEKEVNLWVAGTPAPTRLLSHVESGGTVVAHNAGGFEYPIWNEIMWRRYKWPPIQIEQLICTQAMCFAMAIPGSLEKAALALGLNYQKDMSGYRVMMQLCKPRDFDENCRPIWWDKKEYPEKYEKLYEYCKRDVEVERELYSRLFPLSQSERDVWLLDQKINQRGIRIDLTSVSKALQIVGLELTRLDSEMESVTKGAVETCASVKRLTEWIRLNGVEVDGVGKADVTVLLANESLPPIVRQALEIRKEAAKSSTAKLSMMKDGVCRDGRMRGLFQYHGANTGRWAGRRIQPQNFPRSRIKQEQIDQVFKLLGDIE